MRRLITILVPLLAALLPGCRENQAIPATETGAETTAASAPREAAAPTFDEIRRRLDAAGESIPLWSGVRAEPQSIREENGTTTIDLWTNDSFPMVWHFYVTYLAQYRAWNPEDPFPSKTAENRSLDLDLNEVMRDPFIPGTELDSNQKVTLMIREEPTSRRVNIRYILEPSA